MSTMKLSDIKITSAFLESIPSEYKMNECRNNWNNFHMQDRYLVVNPDGYLIDGYVMYCVLKECGVEEAEVKISSKRKKRWCKRNTESLKTHSYKNCPTTYIFGIHPNSNYTKEFCWRVPVSWGNWAENIEVGDTVLCQTKFGFSPVVVNRVEVLDKPPVDIRVKRVTKREIRRNGLIVEL